MARCCTHYLEQRAVQISVSDVASPWQNGYIESFYGRLKQELGNLDRFETLGEMIEAIYWHIHYYNQHRIHTALKMTPVAYALKITSDNGLHQLGTINWIVSPTEKQKVCNNLQLKFVFNFLHPRLNSILS